MGQCPECGASMSRKPDVVEDVNTHLYRMRMNAGTAYYSGGQGGVRPGSEPMYKDTQAVMEVARLEMEKLLSE